MTRSATFVDRLAALVVGLLLIALGIGALIWNTTVLPRIPTHVTAPALVTATGTPWWPWAVAVAGVLCLALGVRWLLAHTPRAKAKPLQMSEPAGLGNISVDLGALAAAAARSLAGRDDVHSAKGKAVIDRGTRTLELTVTAATIEELPALIEAIDRVCAHLAHATQNTSVATRTTVHLSTNSGPSHHVH
ncbi:alkaline shock response membrane anchor protein AmaP [Rhodococcus sp. CH91]|uniref:alkaline shock response membrane anchor protein AmaP n=1 Tax=Rhodococcus sp. CH91 TaxID=2910256 RepID=UPI001F4BA213|nr:alkaline shock response membrane anchor protein AmaP [Rhodococcus sp. CH91]